MPYGNIVSGFDFSPWIDYMKNETETPEEGNIYIPSVKEMENQPLFEKIQNTLYGGMPIQVGYCNGSNSTYNGFEYHTEKQIGYRPP